MVLACILFMKSYELWLSIEEFLLDGIFEIRCLVGIYSKTLG